MFKAELASKWAEEVVNFIVPVGGVQGFVNFYYRCREFARIVVLLPHLINACKAANEALTVQREHDKQRDLVSDINVVLAHDMVKIVLAQVEEAENA